MCGVVGFLSSVVTSPKDHVRELASTISYRGPDADGAWSDSSSGLTLGHCRLSIIDLTETGAQPMLSATGKSVVSYNGEVYNFEEVARELQREFRGGSDTEVLLEAIESLGVEVAIEKFRGMFALGFYSLEKQELTLVRDRFGIKPLYYGWVGKDFIFASELKPIRAHSKAIGVPLGISREAIEQHLRYGYIPAPLSIYKGIYKLLPGSYLTLSMKQMREPDFAGFSPVPSTEAKLSPKRYWRLPPHSTSQVEMSSDEALTGLREVLEESIKLRMIADVPLGAFLSGGIDSSCVVALMQSMSSRPVKTFSIGFHEARYNEADHAKLISEHLGTEHTELYVTEQDAMDVIPRLPTMYDEPFADSSQIPTYLVSKLAREKVTVSLSGDGGDELFRGYQRYELFDRILRYTRFLPTCLRVNGAKAMLHLPEALKRILLQPALLMVPEHYRHERVGNQLDRGFRLLSQREPNEMYAQLFSHWDTANPTIGAKEWTLGINGNLHGISDFKSKTSPL